MDVVDSLLIFGGDAVRWVCAALATLFGSVWGGLDALLNPLLSPLLAVLNPVCTAIGDVTYAIVRTLPVWVGLTLLSVLAGIAMLVIFRYMSNQTGITRAKDQISANLLAIKLYRDELRVMFRSQWGVLCGVAKLQRYVLTPVLIMLLPMMLGLAQMGMRHQWRPLQPGERTLMKVRFDAEHAVAGQIKLEPSPGLHVEVGPVPGGGELVWRIRGNEPGRHTLRFRVDGTVVEKELVVGDSFERVSAVRPGAAWASQLLHPGESRLPAGSPVASIEILYPAVDSWVYGADYWVLYFFVVSMASALLLKPLFRVTF